MSFRVLPALDAGDRRGSQPGLPYCCSAGLTLATVVGEPSLLFCCFTVNTSNTVQLPTLNSSYSSVWDRRGVKAPESPYLSHSPIVCSDNKGKVSR